MNPGHPSMGARPEDFAPPLLRIQQSPPAPLAGWMLRLFLALLAGLLLFGKLDIVAVAEGKLVPQTYVKILQPSEQGMVKEILETDGRRYPLAPGMQVVAEINLGRRTVLEYILSPVQKAWHEAGRER